MAHLFTSSDVELEPAVFYRELTKLKSTMQWADKMRNLSQPAQIATHLKDKSDVGWLFHWLFDGNHEVIESVSIATD